MTHDTTTGIPNPDRRGLYLVPPWSVVAGFAEVVSHFERFHPWDEAGPAVLLTYYEAYQAALDAVPPDDATLVDRQWRADMRECISRCARLHQEVGSGRERHFRQFL